MYRAKLICNILENKPKYKNRCSIIKSITDNDLMKSNDEKIELFSSFTEVDKRTCFHFSIKMIFIF